VDFSAAIHFVRLFARWMLVGTMHASSLPFDVDVLKIDVPEGATAQTPWRLTRVSRQRYFHPLGSENPIPSGISTIDYEVRVDFDTLESDSDVFALVKDRLVSVSPLTLDLSSRVDLGHLAQLLRSG